MDRIGWDLRFLTALYVGILCNVFKSWIPLCDPAAEQAFLPMMQQAESVQPAHGIWESDAVPVLLR